MLYLKWIFFLGFCIFTSFSFALINPESYPGVVRLIGKTGRGTGAFITSDILSTANHVAEDGPLYFIDDSTGKVIFTRVLYADKDHDLALLKAIDILEEDYVSEHFYPLGFLDDIEADSIQVVANEQSKEPLHQKEIGELVIIPGFPQGSFNIVQGVVTEYREKVIVQGEIVRNVFMIAVTDMADDEISDFKGISGSPVFSEDDQFIGVAVSESKTDDISDKELGFVSVEELRRGLAIKKEDIVKISPSEQQEIGRRIVDIIKNNKHPNFINQLIDIVRKSVPL